MVSNKGCPEPGWIENSGRTLAALLLLIVAGSTSGSDELAGPADVVRTEPSGAGTLAPAFQRVEQDAVDWIYAGSWSTQTSGQPSGGSFAQSASAGDSAQFAFNGSWLSLGFMADRFSGEVEVSIDGIVQGIYDLYRRDDALIRLRFDGLANAAHTVSLTVTGTSNPLASATRVKLDYVDFGDGSLLPDGDFEETDPRLLYTDGWTSTSHVDASGGSYLQTGVGTAWFPFSGDSFSLHTLAYGSAGRIRLFVDGQPLDIIDLYEPVFSASAEPRVFSYQGFGPGHHVLQISSYQASVVIDRLSTPGSAPFTDPDSSGPGVARIEADDPALRFNGLPLTQASTDWVNVASISTTRASAGEVVYSAAAGDVIEFDFEGEWLGVGFLTDRFGGQLELAIDGVVVETLDLYSRYTNTLSRYYRDLGAGPHTLTLTALGTASPASSSARMTLDYLEVWDGLPLAEGVFEDDSDRVLHSRGWSRRSLVDASGGSYLETGIADGTTAWLAFTGDSVSWQSWSRFSYQDVDVRIDGVSVGLKDTYAQNEAPRVFSFDGLGPGPHVLEISQFRDDAATVDRIATPALGPAEPPPALPPIVRYEENHPELRYNDQPYRSMPQSWSEGFRPQASRGYHASSSTPGDRWALDFDGGWLALGFRSSDTSGSVEILIDGVSQGIFDTSGGVNQVRTFVFDALAPGAHTVEAEVISGPVMPDFIDVWAGEAVADGWYELELDASPPGLVQLSQRSGWREFDNEYARDDDLLSPFVSFDTNAWFNFVGTGLTVLAFERENTFLQVVIDGVDQGIVDLAPTAPFRAQPRAVHFSGLAEGAHSVQVALDSTTVNTAYLDAFNVNPADALNHTPAVEWFDTTATESLPGSSGSGFVSTIAIGDLDGNGLVELVAPSSNGRLYVYRGDGQDAGGGSPILWSSDLVGPAAEPALADLDGDGDAEIVVVGREGSFAFQHDGQLLWSNPGVASYIASEDIGWGGPSIGNLDLDPEPEIVIAAQDDALYVLDHLGNVVWSDPLPGPTPTVPVLADLTGDGVLDIVVAQGLTLKVIDYFGGGTVAWSRELPDPIAILGGSRVFGAPAIADLDGDGGAEVIVNWGHVVEALEDDGTLLWRYPTGRTDLYRPSPVTVADVTGDGQPNLVTASAILSGLFVQNHLLMVLDHAGGLVWEQVVADNSASASGVAAQDLTGNGAWEIIWNGAIDGLLLFNGPDGERLYNEPYTGSGTVLDYPSLGDVDGDGQAEIVVAGRNGLFVYGHGSRWVDARPVWNQHNYHINNINGDWSVPFTEANSWELHNTYRTQTPDRDPSCALDIDGEPVPPGFLELSPGPDSLLPTAVPLVISGRVLPVAAGQPLLSVEIDGEAVDLLDASGAFFVEVELLQGPNAFELRAVDRCAEASTTLVLQGGGDDANPWTDMADASVLLEARFSGTTHDRGRDRLLVDVQAFNGGGSLPGPVLMTIGNDADPAVGLLAADGLTPSGEPYVILVPEGQELAASGLSAPRSLAFSNPDWRSIEFTPRFIAPVNQPPYFTSIPDARATVGQAWRYELAAGDGNGDAVQLVLIAGPTGMTLVGDVLNWTPTGVGNVDVLIEARDGRGASARQGFVVRVEDASFNRPPVFTSAPSTQRPIGAEYQYDAEVQDLDGDVLSFSLQAAPAGVTVDPATGRVEWAFSAPGQHSLVLLVDDGRGGQASQAWTLFVGEPAGSVPGPAFASVPQTFAAIGVQYRYAWAATSFDGAPPSVSLLQAPPAMVLDPGTRTLSWVPSGADLGPHVVELQAVDSEGQIALQRFDLEVLAELPNQAPYLVSTPPTAARIGTPYSYLAQAVDPEFETLSWSLASAPAGMAIDPATGQLDWVPDGSQSGDWPVIVQATDPHGGTGVQAFTVRVRAANVDPIIVTGPPSSITVGAFYSVRMLASDGDGDAPIWRLLEAPAGMTLHQGLGWLHWTTTGAAPGSYPVSLEVTDGWGGRDTLDFSIELLADTQVPQVGIRMLADPACRGEAVSVCVDASDNVGLASLGLTIQGQARPLDSARCYRWTPAEAGAFPAIALAIDPSAQFAQADESLIVADCNDEQAPVVTLVSPQAGERFDAPVPIVVDIEDNTPAVLSWEVTLRRKEGEGAPVVLASGTGPVTAGEIAVFDPTVLQAGDYELDIVAGDGAQTGGLRVPLAAGTGAKPGRVAFTVRDLVWQLGAFPLVIGRSYDSLDAGPLGSTPGDFGPGWRLALSASVEDSPDDPPTAGLQLGAEPYTDQTRVTVTKPNGERVGFTFAPQGRSWPSVLQFDVVYEPDPGVTDELRALDWPDIVFALGNGYANYVIPYNPSLFELETAEGMVYVIDEELGLLEVRDPQGGVLSVDENGWQSSWGARVDYLRDGQGRITDIVLIDDDGTSELARVQYGYDALGNLVSVEDVTGGVAGYDYADPAFPHHVTATRDANGHPVAQMVFDAQGRMVAHCPSTGDLVTLDGCSLFDYDSQAGVETLFDPRGFRSDLFFDGDGLLIERHDYIDASQFLEQRWTYDEAGREIEYRDRDGGLTLRERDADGNELRRVLPDGSQWTWTYGDCGSDWLEQCDPLGNCTTRRYDAECRLIEERDPLGQVRQFGFTPEGFLNQVIDAELQGRSFVYNAAGLVEQEIDSLGQTTTFEYNALGQIRRSIDRDGNEREFVFDSDNRLIEERRPGQGTVATWTYNALNQVAGVSNADSQLAFEYDLAGRLDRVEHSAVGAPGWWLAYQYDGSGNVVQIEDSAGGLTIYEYDGVNRLSSIRQSGAGLLEKRVDIESNGSGYPLVIRRYADLAGTIAGPVTTYEYDCASCPAGLSAITHRRPNDELLFRIDFTRNALGQITGLLDTDGLHHYTWDGAGRLVDEQHPAPSGLPSGSTAWDGVGNWLSRPTDPGPVSLAYLEGSAGHRLLGDSVYSYDYTASGQLASREHVVSGERLLLSYSPLQRVDSITLEDGGGATISSASYGYAMNGWRVRAERDGVRRHYAFDFDNPTMALDDAGNVVWRRLHGRSVDRPFAIERGGQLRWLLTDHLGTVRMETDDQSQVLVEYVYDAFGQQVAGPPPSLDDSLRYTGRDFDLPGGLGHYRARLYDPRIGRFVAEDPLRPWHYRYAENNPLSFVDPSGETAAIEYALAVCEVIGLAISNTQLGLSVKAFFEDAANAINGAETSGASPYGLLPGPSSDSGSGAGAGAEIGAKLVIPCGLGNLL
ncbi:putative Ig domain-containing protein [Wenzhouxiangella marina]|uniref:Teneurin-like YD-shell domain-containing protein n=1 Tax=Wenzhouxiangella marina TaxID=1579979 RepID=A0A0K0XVE4_9GAMM|nr:putative Ig domain-containing protein [Wenzhouxiangella marina]AKS41591.1 hypothetical protein WM2015_1217 [Wenzhouxiangella marina]MBB6086650.1 RHS repeat-associated protein [Wenzhouxiangella marina]